MDKIKPKDYNKMPTKVRVLGKNFKIVEMQEGVDEDADGLCKIAEQELHVRPQPAISYCQDTLLHETIHAIDETLVLKMSERQVSNLASVLLAVFKDNPEYIKWILQDE